MGCVRILHSIYFRLHLKHLVELLELIWVFYVGLCYINGYGYLWWSERVFSILLFLSSGLSFEAE